MIVYILQSQRNRRYYIGSTHDLARRLVEHNRGQTTSTRAGIPWSCVFSTECQDAHRVELYLKKLKSRLVIEKIIREQSLACLTIK